MHGPSLVFRYTKQCPGEAAVKITKIICDIKSRKYWDKERFLEGWEEFIKLSLDLPDVKEISFLFDEAREMYSFLESCMASFRDAKKIVWFRERKTGEQGGFIEDWRRWDRFQKAVTA